MVCYVTAFESSSGARFLLGALAIVAPWLREATELLSRLARCFRALFHAFGFGGAAAGGLLALSAEPQLNHCETFGFAGVDVGTSTT